MRQTIAPLAVLLLSIVSTFSLADSERVTLPTSDLAFGITFEEVLKLWGPASEKHEFGTLHQDRWGYPFGSVTFHEGEVVDWEPKNLVFTVVAPNSASQPSTEKKEAKTPLDRRKSKPETGKIWNDVFGEIVARGLSDKDDGVDARPAPPSANPQMNTFQPRIHPGGGGNKEEREKRMDFIRAEQEERSKADGSQEEQ